MNEKIYSGTEKCVIELESFGCIIYCEHKPEDFRAVGERYSKKEYDGYCKSRQESPESFGCIRVLRYTEGNQGQIYIVFPPPLDEVARVINFCTWMSFNVVVDAMGGCTDPASIISRTAALIYKKLLEHKANDQE